MESLSAYLPMDRRHALAQGRDLPDRCHGAALFADISGFTSLTETLAHELGPQRGAEELTRHLNRAYGTLIGEVHRFGGSVIGFSGDALTCWLDQDPGQRATACGLALQQVMVPFAAITTPAGTAVPLAIKVAVAAGPARRFLVGEPAIQVIEVLAGATLDHLAAAERLARPGEVVVGAEVVERWGDQTRPADWRTGRDGQRFAVVTGLAQAVAPAPWPEIPPVRETVARAWLLPPVYQRLRSGQGEFLAELRPAVALFLGFRGIDYDGDDAASDRLDTYIRWVQGVLARYEGHLIQLTMGDKGSYLYAAFGTPVAHDDDTARAVAAVLALRDVPATLDFIRDIQIGLARGQMRVGAYGGAGRRTYGVLGEKTNLAARLMGVAGPGGILCDFEVYRSAEKYWAFEALPPVRVKGHAGLVRVYRPRGEAVSRQRGAVSGERLATSGQGVLVGREREVARLEATLDAVERGESRVLMIEGEAGIGKSRLVEELVRRMRERGLTGLSGAGQSIEQQTAYRAWRDVFTSYFDLDEVPDLSERRERVQAVVQELAPDRMPYLPLLNDVLSLGLPDTDWTAGLEPERRQRSLVSLLLTLLQAWTSERPLILVLEDAYWLDSLSWELAVQVARGLTAAGAPLLLVVVTRPLEQDAPGAGHLSTLRAMAETETLSLTALDPEETVAVAAGRLGVTQDKLPRAVVELVRGRAGGNPFFVEELMLTLQQAGWVRVERDNGHAHCVVRGDFSQAGQVLPDTLRDVILARLDQLPPEAQTVLKMASVIGPTFTYQPLHHVLDPYMSLSEPLLRWLLQDLVIRDFIQLEALEPDLSYRFKHVITQEVVYQTLLLSQRRQLHRSVAWWYETTFGESQSHRHGAGQLAPYLTLLVHHYHHAEDIEKERQYAKLAGEQAAAQYANAEAVRYLSRALALTPADALAERYALLLAREEVYDRQSARESQAQDLTALEKLAEVLGDSRRSAEVALRRANYAYNTSDHPPAISASQRAIEWARQAQDVQQEAQGYLQWGMILSRVQEHDAARPPLRQALDLARTAQARQVEAQSLQGLGVVSHQEGDRAGAQAYYEQAMLIYREIGDQQGEAGVLINLGVTCLQQDDYAGAGPYFEQALPIYQAIGGRDGEGTALKDLGCLALYQGNYVEAQAYFEHALRIRREIGYRLGEGSDLEFLAGLYRRLGDYARARAYLEQALQIGREAGGRANECTALINLGLLFHGLGDNEAAREYILQGLSIAQDTRNRPNQCYALTNLGHALGGLGRLDEAADAYRQALPTWRECGKLRQALDTVAGLARVALARGDPIQVQAYAEEILTHVETHTSLRDASSIADCGLAGRREPFRILLTCYHVLHATEDPRAGDILNLAHSLLMAHAGNIADENLRRSFLENVAAHREIVEAWEMSQNITTNRGATS